MAFSYPTNYSNGTIANTAGKFFMDYPSATINQFGGGIILLIWMAIFAISSYLGSVRAILTASFITALFSVYFSVRGWINPTITIVLVIITIISAIGTKGDGI